MSVATIAVLLLVFAALWRIGDHLKDLRNARPRLLGADMTPGPGETMRTVLVSDKPLDAPTIARIREQLADADPAKPLVIDGGLRFERWPMQAGGPELKAKCQHDGDYTDIGDAFTCDDCGQLLPKDDPACDPFERAARELRGQRWGQREADALAELVELGRVLP